MTAEETRRIALIKVWDAMFRGARSYVEREGFTGVHNAPEIVGITGACENVDTLFKVDFFGRPAYLAQSDQLYLELLTPHLKRVYAEIQSFRMEPDVDRRHLCQFSLFEIEHLGDLEQLQQHLTGILKYAIASVLTHCEDDLGTLGVRLQHFNLLHSMTKSGYALHRTTYTDAVRYLRDNGFPELVWGDDLKEDHEAELVLSYGPCFITHYPLEIKFFNMLRGRDESLDSRHGVGSVAFYTPGAVVNSCDLLLPHAGESAGAAEREHEHDRLEERLKSSEMYRRLIELGGKDEDFAWYLDAHADRDIPLHSGAGIGMARVAQFILGVDDIRDAVPFVINRENLA